MYVRERALLLVRFYTLSYIKYPSKRQNKRIWVYNTMLVLGPVNICTNVQWTTRGNIKVDIDHDDDGDDDDEQGSTFTFFPPTLIESLSPRSI